MEIDRSMAGGSMALLVMKLLEGQELYGYQMIEELRRRSGDAFRLRAGTLYPLLHGLEEQGFVRSREQRAENGKTRRYYRLTESGGRALREKEASWDSYVQAVSAVLKGGPCHGEA